MPNGRLPIAIVLLAATFGAVRVVAAQTRPDSVQRTSDGPPQAWLSLGLGGGSSRTGSMAGRAAASIAVSPLVVLTLEGTGVGSFDQTIDSIDLMAGLRAPTAGGFFFGSAGLANTSCGSGCPNRSGVAFDLGYHAGGRYAGMSVVGFAIRAPGGSNLGGVVFALDIGWFGRSGESGNGGKAPRHVWP